MEKQQIYEVICLQHGKLGLVAQAHLGLVIMNAHRLEVDGCREMEIRPKDVSWLQRFQMRRIQQSGKR